LRRGVLHLSAWGRTADQKKTGKTREIGAIATTSEDFAAAGKKVETANQEEEIMKYRTG
jgi:hypothetical protein